jgi:hypothetical protein
MNNTGIFDLISKKFEKNFLQKSCFSLDLDPEPDPDQAKMLDLDP